MPETHEATTSYTYDATNQLSLFTYPNGVSHNYSSYDSRDRVLTLNGYTQTFSPSGRKQSVAETSGRTSNYTYDSIYRLLNESLSGDPTSANNGALTYVLDPVGNRQSLASTLAALPTQSLTYDADDRLTTDTYDANGNTLTSGGVSYTYDFKDRLLSTSTGVQIVYDGDGNRVSETAGGVTTRFLVDDFTPTGYIQVAEETLSGAVTAQFTYGLQRISQRRAVVSYYGYDGGGSVRQLFDNTGAVTDAYAYDAFGNTVAQTGSTVNEFQYRAEQFDPALRLYYLRARWMNPQTGRFVTADAYETNDENDSPLHPYSYAAADPVDSVDPTGHTNLFTRAMSTAAFAPLWGAVQKLGINARGLASMGEFAQKRADFLQTVFFMQRYAGAVVTNGLRAFNGRTVASAQMINRATGAVETFVSISRDRWTMAMYEALAPFETPVFGGGHAEVNLVNYAQKYGYDIISIAAGRGICPVCVPAILGQEAVQGFKIFMGTIR